MKVPDPPSLVVAAGFFATTTLLRGRGCDALSVPPASSAVRARGGTHGRTPPLLASESSDADAAFHAWSDSIGILRPGAEVRTTPRSVAGRGVFATKPLAEGEVAISVPLYCALTQEGAGGYFPELCDELKRCRRREKPRLLRRIWNRVRRRRPPEERTTDETYWREELTAYALHAVAVDHPWSPWIAQWDRSDPWQALVDSGAWRDEDAGDEAIDACASALREMTPDVPDFKIRAAVGIRLEELDEYSARYGGRENVPASEGMYSTLVSRAIGLSDDVTAVLPMHDMVNHSPEPNLGFAFFEEDASFKLLALRDIPKDEELFICYQNREKEGDDGSWDEDRATWLLVQWGIPSSPSQYPAAGDAKEDDGGD